VDNFRIEIETPVELTAQHRAGVEKAVHHRMIQNRAGCISICLPTACAVGCVLSPVCGWGLDAT
jgi:hypothetical protein